MKKLMSILFCLGLFCFTSCGDTSTQENNRGMQDEQIDPGMNEGTTAGTTGTTNETDGAFESDTTTTGGATTAGTTGTTDGNMEMESDTMTTGGTTGP